MKLAKLDRFFAWILFASMLMFFISGYGMTKGLFGSSLALKIHNEILPPIAIAAFTIHTWYAIHLALKRWQIWNWLSKILLALFFAGFVGYFFYLQYFYQQPSVAENQTNNSEEVVPATTSDTSAKKTFTLSELAKYNGKSGQPSYVAVDGKVYDLSSVFINGFHQGFSAGKDLSAEFHSQHLDSIISGYTIVGTLVK